MLLKVNFITDILIKEDYFSGEKERNIMDKILSIGNKWKRLCYMKINKNFLKFITLIINHTIITSYPYSFFIPNI
jgi:hypothetical protein